MLDVGPLGTILRERQAHGRRRPLLHRRPDPVSAIQAALDKVALGLLDDHAHTCVMGAKGTEKADKTEELMAAVGRLMRRG